VIRVLIVDDHAVLRSGVASRLAQETDIVVAGEAGTVAGAIVKARALKPDLVLLDLLLPDGNGYEAIPELLGVSPGSRVLMISSQASASSVRQALGAGAAGYVSKHASADDLLAAIRRVAAGERYVEPALGANLVLGDRSAELGKLSSREGDVLQLLALGYTNREIGSKLFISVRTVDTHRAHIMRKLGLDSRAELVMLALSQGLIGPA
jgi:DNA-binding NarL/FixJ family response regulator